MSKRKERRTLKEITQDRQPTGDATFNLQAWSYFLSFMLLRDAVQQHVATSRQKRSGFVPSAVIILHAYVDAQINESLSITAELEASSLESEIKSDMMKTMRLPFSSTSKKAEEFAMRRITNRKFSSNIIDDLNLFCDLRDILFHTEPIFLATNHFPEIVLRICTKAGVKIGNMPWKDYASTMPILEWSYATVRAYFKEYADTGSGYNALENTQNGQQRVAISQNTGETSYILSMEEDWLVNRSKILPLFYPKKTAL